MSKKEIPEIRILIDGFKLEKSKYSDVRVLQYTPAGIYDSNCTVIVDFCERKIIAAENEEQINQLINEYLEKSKKEV